MLRDIDSQVIEVNVKMIDLRGILFTGQFVAKRIKDSHACGSSWLWAHPHHVHATGS